MGEWNPGDLAMVLCSDGQRRAAFYAYESASPIRAHWKFSDGLCRAVNISDARRVVLIDPEDREQVERVRLAVGGKRGCLAINRTDDMQDALRSLIAPPKPEEPTGLGAVVEDVKGKRWVRGDDGDYGWVSRLDHSGLWFRYDEIAAVKVLSAGVTP